MVLLSKFSVVMADSLDVAKINQPSLSLTTHLGVLEDVDKTLTLEDVQKDSVQFKNDFSGGKSINLSYTTSAYWLRLVLENSSDKSMDKILDITHALLATVDFYWQIDNENYQTIHTGYARPLENRAYKGRFFAFPMQLPAHSRNVIYFRIETPNALVIPSHLWEPAAFYQNERRDYSFQSAYLGLVIAIALFSLILAIDLKEFVYFLHVSFITLGVLAVWSYRGVGAESIWPNTPWLTQTGALWFGAFAFVVELTFIRRILHTPLLLPKLDNVLKLLTGFNSFIAFLLVWTFSVAKFVVIIIAISSIIIFIVCVIAAFQKERNAYFLCAGLGVFSLGIIINALHNFALVPTNFFTINALQCGSAIELIIFTLLLSNRYQIIQYEKRRSEDALMMAKQERLEIESLKQTYFEHHFAIDKAAIFAETDTNGVITFVNEHFCRISGYSEAELIGSPHNLLKSDVHPPAFYQNLWETIRSGNVWCDEICNKHKNGTLYWLNTVIVPILEADGRSPKKYITIRFDITDRKNLDAEKERFLKILNDATDFIGMSDMQANWIYLNPAAKRMMSVDDEVDLSQFKIDDIHTNKTHLVLREGIPSVLEKGTWQSENTLHDKLGREMVVSQILNLHRDSAGNPEFISTIMHDITDLKHVEHSIREAKEAAEALAKSKTDFLANMSHEIRTPMNAILGLSELALHSTENNQNDYLEKIHGASENLLTILNDILEFSKLDSTGVEIASDYFNLSLLVNNLNNLFEETARQKNLTFELEVSPEVQRHLIGDALRLQQVLTNLLNNSIKFTQTGFVRLRISVAKPDDKQTALTFSIEDSGIGISADQQKLLFQPFTQADTSITRRFGGTGLGLVISQKFIHLMGGEIALESTLNEGSHFWFTLPFEIAKKSHSTEFLPIKQNKRATTEQLEDAAKLLLNKRVLLVEDMPLNQQVASEFLRNAKLRVVVADNGKEALDILEFSNFDVVLMDIQMPVMDGLEATRLIREQPQFATLPIIAMSAGVTLDEQEKCHAAGMSDFIAKPINPLQMLEKLTQNIVNPSMHQILENDVVDKNVKPGEDDKVALVMNETIVLPDYELLTGFDEERLEMLEMMLGSRPRVFHAIKKLILDFSTATVEIQSLLDAEEFYAASRKLHTLKGCSADIGANDVSALAYEIEDSLKRGEVSDINPKMGQLSQAWQVIETTVKTLL
jgi:PAS domain S-box-containing protein